VPAACHVEGQVLSRDNACRVRYLIWANIWILFDAYVDPSKLSPDTSVREGCQVGCGAIQRWEMENPPFYDFGLQKNVQEPSGNTILAAQQSALDRCYLEHFFWLPGALFCSQEQIIALEHFFWFR
jgi:hypothetical protein